MTTILKPIVKKQPNPWPRRLAALVFGTLGSAAVLTGGGMTLVKASAPLIQPSLYELMALGLLGGLGLSALAVAYWLLQREE